MDASDVADRGPPRIEVVDDDTAARKRAMTPEQRAEVSNARYIQARAVVRHQIRRRHPEWSEVQVLEEAARRERHRPI